jgi:hypothetical protein
LNFWRKVLKINEIVERPVYPAYRQAGGRQEGTLRMRIEKAKRIEQIPPYLFAETDKKKAEMRQ